MSDGDSGAALLAQALAHRAQARRARKLALMVGDLDASDNLMKFADELDQKAVALETTAAAPNIPVARAEE